jgi:hypothetical protein
MPQTFPVCFSQTEIGVAATEGIAARVKRAELGNWPDWRGQPWMIRELVERAP